jgi:rare lipoprotein A
VRFDPDQRPRRPRHLTSVVLSLALVTGVGLALPDHPVQRLTVAPAAAAPLGNAPQHVALPDDLKPPKTARSLGRGEASYYHDSLAGNPTASGDPYHPGALTAAHRKLPLGSKVRVTNLDNGRVVVVEVNDRGPFAKGRVIDLSRAAARRLGMIQQGHAEVALELLG